MTSDQRHLNKQLFDSLSAVTKSIDQLAVVVNDLKSTLQLFTRIQLAPSQSKHPKAGESSFDESRDHDTNFARVRQYLTSLNGTMVSIKQIAMLTNIPESSLRVLMYKSHKQNFRSLLPGKSRERVWQLADVSVTRLGDETSTPTATGI